MVSASALVKLASTQTAEFQHTEIGPIPSDWTLQYVEDFCNISTGGRNTQDRVVDGAYPFFVRSQKVENIDTYSYDEEAILTAGDGVGTGKVFHYIQGKYDAHQRVYRMFNFCNEVSPKYFFRYFSANFYARIMQMTAKSSVDSVRRDMISRMPIALPRERSEQDAIAEALSDADSLIESLELLVAKKRAIKKGAMQEILNGKKRLEGFDSKWKVQRIGDLAQIDPDNLGRSVAPDYRFNYISLEGVSEGSLVFYSEQDYVSAPSRARRCLKFGDIIFGTVRPNLKSHLHFMQKSGDWICSTGFCVIRCHPNVADPRYLFQLLFAGEVEKQINVLISGSNYPAVNSRDVAGIEILCPDYYEQMAISSIFSEIDEEIECLERKISKARQIKQGMMQELLTGRTRLV